MYANRHFRRRALYERAHACESGKLAVTQAFFILAALVALTIQILVVQPHIHIVTAISATRSVTLVASGEDAARVAISVVRVAENATVPSPDKYPFNEDPSNCPLCQELVFSSHFVQSAAILAVLLFDAPVRSFSFDEPYTSSFAASHIWHSRAPPKV